MADINTSIRKNIIDQLFWDSRINAANIEVEVSNSKVTLSGGVRSEKAKKAAEIDALATPGVSAVVNRLDIRYPENQQLPNDVEIQSRIRDVLLWNANIDSTNVFVTVNEGKVTLEGTTSSYWQKKLIEEVASNITGVVTTVNKLEVEPWEKIIDDSLAKKILVSLDRNHHIDVDTINVKVDDGVVTLYGSVHNWAQYYDALATACHTVGVVDVVAKLRIDSNNGQ